MSSEQERTELEARVFSRAGADDPRTEHVDPATLRVLLMTDSEWRLLEFDRFSAGVGGARRVRAAGPPAPTLRTEPARAGGTNTHEGPHGGAGHGAVPLGGPGNNAHDSPRGGRGHGARPLDGSPARGPLRRRHVALLALVAAAAAIAAALVVAALGAPALVAPARSDERGDAVVDVTIVPRAPAAAGSIAGPRAADAHHHHDVGTLAVFLDPDRTRGSLPGWLEKAIPSSRVAQLASPTGPIAGVGIYAATTPDRIACLIARIEAAEMIWSCAPVPELATDGMVLRTAIPEGLGSGLDPDGDGISGDAGRTDLLVVEWHADGTFRIAREPG